MAVSVRPATPNDAATIAGIYNHYIENTVATFEEQPVDEAIIGQRMSDVCRSYPWLVVSEGEQIIGYAYANRWKDRSAYRYTVESTVYLAPHATGRGIGRPLYEALLNELRERGFHSVIGGVSLPNPASEKLHEKLGFTKVGHIQQAGWKQQRWVDVAYWQLVLE